MFSGILTAVINLQLLAQNCRAGVRVARDGVSAVIRSSLVLVR